MSFRAGSSIKLNTTIGIIDIRIIFVQIFAKNVKKCIFTRILSIIFRVLSV